MKRWIKIEKITNLHAFNGVEIPEREFYQLLDILRFSRYQHRVDFIDVDNKHKQTTIGRVE